jgi:glucose 1-dehydrogenase
VIDRALTVQPGVADSARVDEIDPPAPSPSDYLVETLLVGVCGTDAEIVSGAYGTAPSGDERLVLGHEALGRVVSAPEGAGLAVGQLVVPIVRRPDPVPCVNCAAGEWDMCRNGQYTEHGIKGAHGFARTRFAVEPSFTVAVPDALGDLAVLVEPASVVAKAWDHIGRLAQRARSKPRTALITGAGPVGLLAALLAAQLDLDVHVLDRHTDGPKPGLVADLGAAYHTGAVRDTCPEPDVIVECTGVGQLVLDAIEHTAPNGIVCLAGLSSGARTVDIDGAAVNRRLVLENDVVFGTVNANRRHYESAVAALAAADPAWLARLITRREPLPAWRAALEKRSDDVKVVIDMAR